MISISDQSFWQKLEDNNRNRIKLIAVVDEDFGISKSDTVPWAFSEDLRFFKRLTENSVVIMGRKTFFSLPNAPLNNRINCVISRTIETINGVDLFKSLEEAVKKYKNAWIIGGAEIYNYALNNDLVDFAIITQVHEKFGADRFLDADILNNEANFKNKALFTSEKYDVTSYVRV